MNRQQHITKILEGTAFDQLSAAELSAVRDHIIECRNCRTAFQTARISAVLLKESSPPESPAPFFQAKVLNAWREKQFVQKPVAAFWRWWQASATLVLLMFLTMVGLMTVSLVASNSETSANRREVQSIPEMNLYSTETVILNQKPPRNLTNEQVFEVLYDGK